ncbi:unnamed protein product [Prorocentrum cordatum]|uniref:SAM domain-containing protein n=1 Tax=Prorocentrum cordatum TaxID=2364126 RepID=A0ABN9TL39_9DINO|nr:unnamed protein product [Polarella glacialis]
MAAVDAGGLERGPPAGMVPVRLRTPSGRTAVYYAAPGSAAAAGAVAAGPQAQALPLEQQLQQQLQQPQQPQQQQPQQQQQQQQPQQQQQLQLQQQRLPRPPPPPGQPAAQGSDETSAPAEGAAGSGDGTGSPSSQDNGAEAAAPEQLAFGGPDPICVGEYAYQDGDLALVVHVDHTVDPASYVVQMVQTGQEVSTQRQWLMSVHEAQAMQQAAAQRAQQEQQLHQRHHQQRQEQQQQPQPQQQQLAFADMVQMQNAKHRQQLQPELEQQPEEQLEHQSQQQPQHQMEQQLEQLEQQPRQQWQPEQQYQMFQQQFQQQALLQQELLQQQHHHQQMLQLQQQPHQQPQLLQSPQGLQPSMRPGVQHLAAHPADGLPAQPRAPWHTPAPAPSLAPCSSMCYAPAPHAHFPHGRADPPRQAPDRCRCGASNFEERGSCRRCGTLRAGAPASCPPPAPTPGNAAGGRAGWPPLPGAEHRSREQAPGEGARDRPAAPVPSARPPAPEDAAAAAAEQAAALEASADQLDSARLGPEAAQLRRKAAELRKRAAAPAPGRRLDLLEAYVHRAATRASKAAAAVEAAEVSLAEARSTAEALQAELEEGRAKLAQLRAELQAEPADEAWERHARALLQALNTPAVLDPVTGRPPESIAAPMAALYTFLGDTAARVPAARLDEAIEEEPKEHRLDAGAALEEEEDDDDEMSEEELMDKLDEAAEDNGALLEVARRLQRTRKLGLKQVAPAAAGEVHALLAGIGLARYSQRIAAAGVATVEALRALRDEDMRQAGMLPGHVRLLKKHLAARAAEGQPGASAGGARASAPPRPAKRLRVPSDGREAAALVEPEAAALAEGRGLQVQEIALRAAAEFAALSFGGGPAGVGAELAGAAPEGETRHLLALRTAQAAAACAEPEPPGPEDTPLALALLAEDRRRSWRRRCCPSARGRVPTRGSWPGRWRPPSRPPSAPRGPPWPPWPTLTRQTTTGIGRRGSDAPRRGSGRRGGGAVRPRVRVGHGRGWRGEGGRGPPGVLQVPRRAPLRQGAGVRVHARPRGSPSASAEPEDGTRVRVLLKRPVQQGRWLPLRARPRGDGPDQKPPAGAMRALTCSSRGAAWHAGSAAVPRLATARSEGDCMCLPPSPLLLPLRACPFRPPVLPPGAALRHPPEYLGRPDAGQGNFDHVSTTACLVVCAGRLFARFPVSSPAPPSLLSPAMSLVLSLLMA